MRNWQPQKPGSSSLRAKPASRLQTFSTASQGRVHSNKKAIRMFSSLGTSISRGSDKRLMKSCSNQEQRTAVQRTRDKLPRAWS
eukprot:6179519-Pleurochrysis_carterae.AAC.1